jgi:hypothetical protein
MELQIGATYEIIRENRRWVVKVKNEDIIKYDIVVLEDNQSNQVNYTGTIMKDSVLIKKGVFTIIEDRDEKKKRRTSAEKQVDDLVEYVQRNFYIAQLQSRIDTALDEANQELFLELSKEYAKLKRKVSV